jgi:tRNA-dihydrouridine synthase
MHQFLIDNPDFVEFCKSNNILSQVEIWLTNPTTSTFEEIKNLIETSQFTPTQSDQLAPQPALIGNGDVDNYEHGLQLASYSGVDGLMIGRGIFRDPWAFLSREEKVKVDTKANRLKLLIEHITNWDATWSIDTHPKHFPSVRKFVKMYINSFPAAVELRTKMMEAQTPQELIQICEEELRSSD